MSRVWRWGGIQRAGILQLNSKVKIRLLQPAVDLGVRSALWPYLWKGINLISSALKTGLAKAQAKYCREHLPQPCWVRQSLPLSLKSISQLAATAWKCPIINLWVFSLLVSRLFFFLSFSFCLFFPFAYFKPWLQNERSASHSPSSRNVFSRHSRIKHVQFP